MTSNSTYFINLGISPKASTDGGSELSARSAGYSETENGQEQGELRAAANKATMFQPVRGKMTLVILTEGVQENRFTCSYLLYQLTL